MFNQIFPFLENEKIKSWRQDFLNLYINISDIYEITKILLKKYIIMENVDIAEHVGIF